MPSPIGHVLGGVAVAYVMGGRGGWRLPAVCAVAAALPDIDFLLPLPHRGPTHSIAAAVIVCAATLALVAAGKGRARIASAVGLAVLSHVLLDWLGEDSSAPRGVMALWPLTSAYYVSDLNLFHAVDRRYWLPGFWWRNTVAISRESLILGPVAILAALTAKRRAAGKKCTPPVANNT
ncbi:MAG TPA: metal-dependent hydrolase [Vicinamibacterales bacterium]|nr:metal-dependent hydrolase [Vicinamibacterales bacterium]